MEIDMIRVRVAYENPFRTHLWLVWIQPEIKLGQKDSALIKFKLDHQ